VSKESRTLCIATVFRKHTTFQTYRFTYFLSGSWKKKTLALLYLNKIQNCKATSETWIWSYALSGQWI